MKKHAFLLLGLASLFSLVSCADNAGGDQNSSESASSAVSGGNTLSSVLGSLGKNLRTNTIFQYVNSTSAISIMTDYVEEGCFYTFRNIEGSPENFGFVSKDNKTYRYTEDNGALVLGDELLKSGASVSSFRDVYYDPSYVGEHVSDYTAANVFVPAIANQTFGTYSMKKNKDGQDNGVLLTNFAKALGVYETGAALDLDLEGVDLYFSEKGTSYTATFTYSKDGGYDGLKAVTTISNIGKTNIKAIADYLK